MVHDLSQIETSELKLCETCKAKPREGDKFCRRCGGRIGAWGEFQSVSACSSLEGATSALSQDIYHRFSGRLAAAAVTSISCHIAPLHNSLSKSLISALLSIPIWLIIVLFSPLDAYATAKTISKQM